MKNINYKVSLALNYSDFNLLLNSIRLYGLCSTFINNGDLVESCNDIRYKIFNGLECYIKE